MIRGAVFATIGLLAVATVSGCDFLGNAFEGNEGCNSLSARTQPCVCGHPDSDATAAAACAEQKACQGDGGLWSPDAGGSTCAPRTTRDAAVAAD